MKLNKDKKINARTSGVYSVRKTDYTKKLIVAFIIS
jgi:hypothetical protein